MDISRFRFYEKGQYWFNTSNLQLRQIAEVGRGQVTFEDGTSVSFLGEEYIWLRYTGCVPREQFLGHCPIPGQMWVNLESNEVFIIHPDQSLLPEGDDYRVLSNNACVYGECQLLRDLPKVIPEIEAAQAKEKLQTLLDSLQWVNRPGPLTIRKRGGSHYVGVRIHQVWHLDTHQIPLEIDGVPVVLE